MTKYHFHCWEEMKNMFKVEDRYENIYTVYAVSGDDFLIYDWEWKWVSMCNFSPVC